MENAAATVGIIIPAYNAESVIERCLDSLVSQSYPHFRAVIINDGSTDATGEILSRYAASDSRVTLVQGAHAGASTARNLGLQTVETLSPDYVTFLDADDYLDPDALAELVNTAERTGAEVVHCKYYSEYVNGYKEELGDLFPPGSVFTREQFPHTVYWKLMTGIQMNHVCTKLYRAELIRGMRLDTTLPTAEDLMMNVELLTRAKSYAYLAKPLYHYIRDFSQSLTNSSLSLSVKLSCNWRVSLRILELLPSWGMNSLRYRLCAICRPLVLICSKSYRLLRARLVRVRHSS